MAQGHGENPYAAFGAVLRRARQQTTFNQDDVAEQIGVKRPTVSQWETGRHLPSVENLDALERMLGLASGELSIVAERRAAVPVPAPRPPQDPPEGLSLYDVHRAMGRVLVREHLVYDESGGPVGWRRDFDPGLPPSAFTTASAVRLLTTLQDPPYVDRHALGQRLLDSRQPKPGGWKTRTVGPRPEATAVVIDALDRLGAAFDVDRALSELDTLMSGRDRDHTYVLVEALSVAARLRPGSDFTRELAVQLLALRDLTGAAWPEKRPVARGAIPQASIAHTARTLTVLTHALERGLGDPGGRYQDAVGEARNWLATNVRPENLSSVRENLDPMMGGMEIRHFTPALVVQAMTSVDEPVWSLLEQALERVWAGYLPAVGLWQWPNGDIPVWLQLDALRAVTIAHSRLTPLPAVVGRVPK